MTKATNNQQEEILVKINIDKSSWFYKNCKSQRKREAKICQCCPFRSEIEKMEGKI